jgi:uncharacterized protein
MQRMIFVNLPVRDVARATDFYTGLGFRLDPRFSDTLCSCLVVSDTICVMALHTERFADFLAGPVGDPAAGTTVINCLSAESRDEVDTLVGRALAGGGSPWLDKIEDGPMYGHSFADPDGHVWEVLHMQTG